MYTTNALLYAHSVMHSIPLAIFKPSEHDDHAYIYDHVKLPVIAVTIYIYIYIYIYMLTTNLCTFHAKLKSLTNFEGRPLCVKY